MDNFAEKLETAVSQKAHCPTGASPTLRKEPEILVMQSSQLAKDELASSNPRLLSSNDSARADCLP